MMQATVEQLSLFHPGSRFGEPGEGGPGRRIDPCPRFPPSAPLKGADRGIENRGSGTVDTGTRSGEGGKRGKAELFEQRRKRVRELRNLGENTAVEGIQKIRTLVNEVSLTTAERVAALALQSQAADRLLARLPVEKLDDDAGAPAAAEATVQIYLPERLPEPE